MRHKPKYNQLRLIYVDLDGNEHLIYCNNVTNDKTISNFIGQPVKDSGSRFITDSDVEFEIKGVIMMNDVKKRITALPEIKIKADNNNARRGYYRKDKVIETT